MLHRPVEVTPNTSHSDANIQSVLRGCFLVLPRFGGHLKLCAIMRKEVSYDEEEAIQTL